MGTEFLTHDIYMVAVMLFLVLAGAISVIAAALARRDP